MFLIDMDVPELVGTAHDPKNLIARAGLTGPVWMTIIGGEPVYRDGRLQGIDEQAYAEMGEKVCDRDLRIPFKHIYS
jgi:hydroxyatrazine ethylaminohydrolase